MNEFPPGYFISDAMKGLPAAGPDVPPQTVEIDARPGWGRYRVTFVAKRNPRHGDAVLVLDDGDGGAPQVSRCVRKERLAGGRSRAEPKQLLRRATIQR